MQVVEHLESYYRTRIGQDATELDVLRPQSATPQRQFAEAAAPQCPNRASSGNNVSSRRGPLAQPVLPLRELPGGLPTYRIVWGRGATSSSKSIPWIESLGPDSQHAGRRIRIGEAGSRVRPHDLG